MRIVVNHLTRMQPGYICVAGIDVQDNEHIRPVLGRERLTVGLLARNGGAFDMGRLVDLGSGRPGSLLTPAPHRSGRAGSAASGSSTDGFATRRRVPAGPGSQAMATAIPKAYLASSAIRCRDVETGPNLGVLAVFPSTGATCRCPLPSTGSRGLNSPASAVL